MNEQKEVNFEFVKNLAKDIIQKQKYHNTQLMMEVEKNGKKGIEIVVFAYKNSTSKVEMRKMIKKLIINRGIRRYWFISDIWVSKIDKGNIPVIPASRNINRQNRYVECLL